MGTEISVNKNSTLPNCEKSAKVEAINNDEIDNDENIADAFTNEMIDELKDTIEEDEHEKAEELNEKMNENDGIINEGNRYIQQATRSMILKDYTSAVDCFAHACDIYSNVYGDLGKECGELLLMYGRALLELWRYNSANEELDNDQNELFLNNTVDNGDESSKNKDIEVKSTGDETNDKTRAAEKNENLVDCEDDNDYDNSSDESESVEQDETIVTQNGDDEEEEDENDGDATSNLDLSWEVLESARIIFDNSNDHKNLAKVLALLSEVSIELKQYDRAIEDLQNLIVIYNKLAEEKGLFMYRREIASVHIQLYTIESLEGSFDKCQSEIREAKAILKDQIYELEEKLENNMTNKTDESDLSNLQKEKSEIESLIADLDSKMKDLMNEKRRISMTVTNFIEKEYKNRNPQLPNNSAASQSHSPEKPKVVDVGETSSSVTTIGFDNSVTSNLPVNNISNLVRKKVKSAVNEKQSQINATENSSNAETSATDETNSCSMTLKRKCDTSTEVSDTSTKKVCLNK